VWTVKTKLSENGDVIQIDTTRRQQRIESGANFPDDILKCTCVEFTLRVKAFSNGYGVVLWTVENDTKTTSVDANLFENEAKQLRFRLKTD